MSNTDTFFTKSKTFKYFEKKTLDNESLRNTLIALEELLNIKKNIKNIYNTDDPNEIKKLIGKKITNLIVQEKDYEYALLIDTKYKEIYNLCKKMLEMENKK